MTEKLYEVPEARAITPRDDAQTIIKAYCSLEREYIEAERERSAIANWWFHQMQKHDEDHWKRYCALERKAREIKKEIDRVQGRVAVKV